MHQQIKARDIRLRSTREIVNWELPLCRLNENHRLESAVLGKESWRNRRTTSHVRRGGVLCSSQVPSRTSIWLETKEYDFLLIRNRQTKARAMTVSADGNVYQEDLIARERLWIKRVGQRKKASSCLGTPSWTVKQKEAIFTLME